ncbi:histidine kinase [Paenibacillus sp. P96]|uniref:Histidine kinase n=1 Tax=Paenibacillus zeirhizosphaerae TaxID=2987519 RepID=A0ABT9FUY3_9BACL|nr:sensor histidine kinase [Paenibacillus sp. P96]MDP4098543.1 histidine kinase [Paenibacillus sp. P96]
MKFRSIRFRLSAFMLAAVAIPLLLSMTITFLLTKQSLREQTTAENERLIFQGAANLEHYLQSVNQASIAVYNDPHFLSNLARSPNDYRAAAEIYTTLQTIRNTVPGITSVYMHSYAANQSTLITSSAPKRGQRGQSFTESIVYRSNRLFIEASHPAHLYGFSSPGPAYGKDTQVFTLHRSIQNIPSTRKLAALAIDVSLDTVRSICRELYQEGSEQLYLLDSSGSVVYSSDENLIGQRLDHPGLTGRLDDRQEQGYFEADQAMHVYRKLNAELSGWTLVKQIPYDTLYARATRLTQINAGITGVALFIAIIGTLLISIRITEPIKQLLRYMEKIQAGQLDVDIRVASRDEIGVVFRRFRQMMDTVNNLILREYRLELANKTNQLKALQAQINPHFLYNTLQSIGTLALQHEVPRIYSLLTALSKIMRYSMRNSTAVQLKDEAEHVRLYLDLQKERFGEQFDVVCEWEAGVLQEKVPKMILQPMVENVFKHGMDARLGRILLRISGTRPSSGMLHLVVENSGLSIPQERLVHLRHMLSSSEETLPEENTGSDEPIGLRNVLLRTRLHAGGAGRLDITNIEPHGVRVILEIQIEERERL